MALKYNYTVLIATASFSESLIRLVETLSQVPFITVGISVNGEKGDDIASQYAKMFVSANVVITAIRQAGKSRALNHYIRQNVKDESTFIIFTDDDTLMSAETVGKYIGAVEKNGRGYFYGGSVHVVRNPEINSDVLKLYPSSIKGVDDVSLLKNRMFLGCNWGAFATDLKTVNYFSPYFGPGSITGSVGQESDMMIRLVKAGIKPFVIENCAVTHVAPENYHTLTWLCNRKYREGIQKGLNNKGQVLKMVVNRLIRLTRQSPFERKLTLHFVRGLLSSFRYFSHNLHQTDV